MLKKFFWIWMALPCGALAAQTPVPDVTNVSLPAQDGRNDRIRELMSRPSSPGDYRLGADDVIEISVFGVEDFRRDIRVNALGIVSVPYLGDVEAGGLTVGELEQRMEEMLDGQFIKNPQVSIFIKEHRSRPVAVMGAVNKPGQYQMIQQMRLIDVLSLAGGLNEKAGETIVVQRHGNPNPMAVQAAFRVEPDVVNVDIKELLQEGRPELNLQIQPNDVVNVQEREVQHFYLIGEVNNPGAFELPFDNNVRLTQALAWAGGPMKTAKITKGILVRYNGEMRQEMQVDFKKVLRGQIPDLEIHPNDVIFVPGSTFKNIGYGLLGVIPGTVSSAILYRR